MTRAWREPVRRLALPVPMMKVGATLAVVGVAFGMLWLADQRGRLYYQTVAQVLANPEKLRGRRLLVRGYVGCGSIERRVGTDQYRFRIEDDTVEGYIDVQYTGPLPDLFASGRDVAVKGRLRADGSFDVIEGEIMTACPSHSYGSPQARCPTVSSGGGEAF